MATSVARLLLTARDRASRKIKRLAGNIQTLGTIAVAVGTVALAKQLSDGIQSAVNEAAKYETQTTRLQVALANQGELTRQNVKDLTDFAAATSRISLATETQILSAVAQAKSLGASNEAAKKLTLTATDLASATGVDMETAFRQINKTLGGYAGELGELFPELKALTKEQLQAGAAADVLAAKVAGAGAAGAKTYEGAVNNLNSELVRLKVEVGAPLRDVLTALLNEAIIPIVENLTAMVKDSSEVRDFFITIGKAAAIMGLTLEKLVENTLPALSKVTGVDVEALKGLFRSIRDVDASAATVEGSLALMNEELDKAGMAGAIAKGILDKIISDETIEKAKEMESPFLRALAKLEELRQGGASDKPIDIPVRMTLSEDEEAQIRADIEQGLADEPVRFAEVVIPTELFDAQLDEMRDAAIEEMERVLEKRKTLQRENDEELLQQQIDASGEMSALRLKLLQDQIDAEFAARVAAADAVGLATHEIFEAWQLARENLEQDFEERKKERERATAKEGVMLAANSIDTIFGTNKASAIATAIINTAEGVSKALTLPFPLNFAVAGLVAAAGAVEISKIRSTKRPKTGFQFGGIARGPAGIDAIDARLTAGELVADTTEAEARAILGGRAAIVPIGGGGGRGRGADFFAAEAQALRGLPLSGDAVADFFERNSEALWIGLREMARREEE